MANVVDCTGEEFRKLVNPYTGEPMAVKMVITPDGTAMFYAPDTYSTWAPFGSVKEAHRMWSRVDGVFGCRPDDVPATCAYTGETLVPTDEGGYVGGFDPTIFHPRDEFLYYATMRDGNAVRPKPDPSPSRVTPVAEPTPAPVSREAPYVEGALEAAGKAMEKSGFRPPKRSTVSCGINVGKKAK